MEVQSCGIASNVSMKGGTHDVLSKIERANKIVTLDKFVKEVTPLMDDSGEKLDLNKLSKKDLEFLSWVKKWIVEKYSKGIETLEGLKKFFSADVCMRPPLLYNEKNGVYNGVKVIIGTPVKEGEKYIKSTAKNELEAARELGLKSKVITLPKIDPYYKHYKEVLDNEGRVLRRDEFIWDNDEKVMFWTERHFKPEDYVRSYDVNINEMPISKLWDKELIDEYNCNMNYFGKVRSNIVTELRKRGIIPKNQMPEFIK